MFSHRWVCDLLTLLWLSAVEKNASDSGVGFVPRCSSLWKPFLIKLVGILLSGDVYVFVYLVGSLVNGR